MPERKSSQEAEPSPPPDIHALAQVAGGIGPALGDALTIIASQTARLLDLETLEPGARDSLHVVYTAADRAVALVRQLRLVSGQYPVCPSTFDLNDFLDEKLPAVRSLVSARTEIEFRPGSSLPRVKIDEELLEQLLVELSANANAAMGAGGRLEIATTVHTLGESDAKAYPDGRPGTYVVLTFADEGGGIPLEIRRRLFSPFVTSRDPRSHVGLGLAAAYRIVRLHEGWITVDSAVGQGSRFSIFWPAVGAGTRAERPDPAAATSGETVLLLEDDPLVRAVTTTSVRALGYRVVACGTVDEVRRAWKWQRDQIALFMTDVLLPDAESGPEIANQLFADKPTLAVILISGHDQSILKRTAAVPGSFQFLQKPWLPQTLARLIQQLLSPTRHEQSE